jgi:hypothetical protein
LLYEEGLKFGSTLSQFYTILVKSKLYNNVELNFWRNKKKIMENNGVRSFRGPFEDQWRTQEFCSGGGGVQKIQLRKEDRENGDLGAVAS